MSIFKDFRDFLKERYENNESKKEAYTHNNASEKIYNTSELFLVKIGTFNQSRSNINNPYYNTVETTFTSSVNKIAIELTPEEVANYLHKSFGNKLGDLPDYHNNKRNNISYYRVLDSDKVYPLLSVKYLGQLHKKLPPITGASIAYPLKSIFNYSYQLPERLTRSNALILENEINKVIDAACVAQDDSDEMED